MTYYAGYDIGGTNARLKIFDDRLDALHTVRRRIRDATAPGDVADTMVDMLEEGCEELDIETDDVDAVGVGLAAQLSPDRRTVRNAPNLGWRNIDFVELFEDTLADIVETAPSIRLVNDLNAQLWGEHVQGAVEGVGDVLAVYVGTGIGGAILADGHLVTGADGNAGEIGHSKVVVGGRPCGCGEDGCVEAYAGGIHLERQVAELIADTGDPMLQQLETEEGIDLGAADEMIERHHDVGDIWEQATDFLSMVIANAVTLLNPRVLLIGGGVFENCDNFRSITLQKAVPIVLEVSRENLEIEVAALGDVSGMIGAADLARRQ